MTDDPEIKAILAVGEFIRQTGEQVTDCKNSIEALIKGISIMNNKLNGLEIILNKKKSNE